MLNKIQHMSRERRGLSVIMDSTGNTDCFKTKAGVADYSVSQKKSLDVNGIAYYELRKIIGRK